MKTLVQMKARGPTRVNMQQGIFELKHKVVLALNKLRDRDTYQIGVNELEKTSECLTPDRIVPFLSCILDTDSEQKSVVRKECIRLMGTLARVHEGLIGPHLGKMVASIVKRLKDPDSVVRDACVETFGVLASKLSNHGGETDGVFVVLVKPLFEALGEQNKQVQSGSALCLARIIDNTHHPPISLLQKMLTRTTKFLKNPHFMAKPAVLELNRSIIQVGGAPTQNILSGAMAGIEEALKNSDWATRKAASVVLGDIAATGGSFLGSFRSSSIRSLESCRFDKVKPVRDAVLQALQYWRSLPGPDTPEHSEAGSSIKENFYGGDYSDITSTSESGWKDVTLKKTDRGSNKGMIAFSSRKACQNYVGTKHPKDDDWHIEIAVPKSQNVSLAESRNEESEGSSVTKTLERMSTDVTSPQEIGYEYVPMDDKQECSSVSNLATDNFETKFVTVSHDCLEGVLLKPIQRTQRFAAEESSDERTYSSKMQGRRSLDSTVTESCSQTAHGCCSQMANEMVCIRKQLSEIENKQSNLLDLLQMFTTGIMDSLTSIRSRVVGLEHVVDRVAQDLVHGGQYSDLAISKLVKQSQSVHSPQISTCTPRPSVDINNRQPSLLSVKSTDIREVSAVGRCRSSNSAKQGTNMWTNTNVKTAGNLTEKDMQKCSGQGMQNVGCGQIKKADAIFASGSSANVRQNGLENQNNLWNRVKGFLCDGDVDSAYMEALCSHDELVMVELLDRTGPVLESLSPKTASDILSTLASYLLEQRFMNSIIPWLQQVVDLSIIHGPNYLVLSAKARREVLSAIQEAINMEFSNPVERRAVAQLAMKLHHIWGKCS